MRMNKMIAAVAALSLASPAVAAPLANPATSLSVARASAPTAKASKLADGPSTLTALILGGLVVAGIVVAATSGDDDDADSN